MFKTYSHAELGPSSLFGGASARHWQFVELEVNHPWFYVELVQDYGDDIVGSMLMIPTVPIFQQMLLELNERAWFAQAHLMCPGYLRGGVGWLMEPLIEVSVVKDDTGSVEGYVYRVEGGTCYSIHHAAADYEFELTEIIFSAERDLCTRK